jgi:fibronectin-binding autotransporter adhesin
VRSDIQSQTAAPLSVATRSRPNAYAAFLKRALKLIPAAALALAAISFAGGGTVEAATCTTSWTGGAGTGSWQDANNWSTHVVPGPTDNACISVGASVFSSADVTIKTISQTAGSLTIAGGTFSLTDSTNQSLVRTFTMTGGAIAGAGTLTVNGTFSWQGGSMQDSGTTEVLGSSVLTLSTGNTKLLGRILTIDSGGTLAQTAGAIGTNTGAIINVSGIYDVQADVGLFLNSALGQLNVNSGGVFKKSAGSGLSSFNIAVANSGSVQALSGTLSLDAGSGAGTSTGSFSASAGATLEFSGNTQNMGGSAIVSGAGTIQQNGGTTTFAGASWSVSGQTNEINGGTINFNVPASTVGGTQNGTIGGSSTYTINGAYEWQSGSMQDSGTTAVGNGGVLTLDTGNTKLLGRTLSILSGGTLVQTAGAIGTNTGAIINIAGIYDVQADVGLFLNSALGQLNVNSGGVFKKSAGSGLSSFNIAVTNSGTISVLSGTLALQSNLTNYDNTAKTLTGGTYTVSGGATLQFVSADVHINRAAVSLNGAGSRLFDGTFNGLRNLSLNDTTGSLTLSKGAIVTTAGAFTNKGTLGIGVVGPTPGTAGQLQVGGTATIAGTLALSTTGFTPVLNQVYTFMTYTSHLGKFKTITGQAIPSSTLAYSVKLGATSATLTVVNSADTSLTGTAPATIGRSTAYTYVETIHNIGPGPATKIVFTDTLPAGVTFVSATSTSGTCTATTTTPVKVTCMPPGSLASGGTITITINVISPAAAGTITNKVTVKSAELDLNAKNNSLTQKTTVT